MALDDELLRRYLLGGLGDAEREQLEEECFANEETWGDLKTAETSLIDAYVRRELPPAQQERFEKHYLTSPRKRTRVEFAQNLLSPQTQRELRSPWSWGRIRWNQWRIFAACGLAVAGLAIVLTVQIVHLRGGFSGTTARTQAQSKPPLSAAKPVISVLLQPGASRDMEGNNALPVVSAPVIPSTVELILYLERDEYPSYEAAVQNAMGKEVAQSEKLSSKPLQDGGKAVAARFSSRLFEKGSYVVLLFGLGDHNSPQLVNTYVFTVR